MRRILIGSLCVAGVTAWADGPASGSEVTSTNVPLISTQELEEIAQRCSHETNELLEKRHDVPRQGVKGFSIALGVASQDCMELQKVVEWLRTGTQLKVHYDRYIAMARDKVGMPGAGDALGVVPVEGGHAYEDEAITSVPLSD